MTSILEPFASKKRPNETGTCSVYASVNKIVKNVENNEGSVFTIEGNTAETTYNLKAPAVETNQFKITASNAEIDKNNSNAVNKNYCDSRYAKIGSESGSDMTGYQKILKRKRIWYFNEHVQNLKLTQERETLFIESAINFSDFPTPNENDELEFWIFGSIEITKTSDSDTTSPLTVVGKDAGKAGLISLDFNIVKNPTTFEDHSIPLNWSIRFAGPSDVIIKINTVGKVFASEFLTGILPVEAKLRYYSANYTKNPLAFKTNLQVYATLIRTI